MSYLTTGHLLAPYDSAARTSSRFPARSHFVAFWVYGNGSVRCIIRRVQLFHNHLRQTAFFHVVTIGMQLRDSNKDRGFDLLVEDVSNGADGVVPAKDTASAAFLLSKVVDRKFHIELRQKFVRNGVS